MTPLRGIAIGAGYFSHYQYEAWSRIPEVRLLAVVNRSVDRAREVASKFALPRAASLAELPALLDELRPDFLDIITPPETHLELVRLAAARGIAVICQKPLAPTWAEAVAVVDAARTAGIRFLVHENWRWQPWYREIRRRLDAGALGRLHSIAVRMRMGDGWQPDAYLARQPFFRTYPRLLIHETGVHFLDTFRYLGGEVESVYARLQKRNPDIAGEDAGQVVCTFASGATAILDASRYNEAETADPRYTFGTVRLDGSAGHLELDTEGNLTLKPLGAPARRLDYAHERRGFAGDCVYALQRHFVDGMLAGAPFESTGEDYLKSVALAEACYQSHLTGEVARPAAPGRAAPRLGGLDHIALAVPSTEEALRVWRDRFGFGVLYSEEVNGGAVRLTHLGLGNTHLQLVEPLVPNHPLHGWLKEHGPSLHHFCLRVADVDDALRELPRFGLPTAQAPHQGTQGKRALFLDRTATQGIQVEVTGA
jgi:methylmalonyl-CoA epimerase